MLPRCRCTDNEGIRNYSTCCLRHDKVVCCFNSKYAGSYSLRIIESLSETFALLVDAIYVKEELGRGSERLAERVLKDPFAGAKRAKGEDALAVNRQAS